MQYMQVQVRLVHTTSYHIQLTGCNLVVGLTPSNSMLLLTVVLPVGVCRLHALFINYGELNTLFAPSKILEKA